MAQALFPDRGQSPERRATVEKSKRKGVDLTEKPKGKGYVPPNQRGPGGRNAVEGMDIEQKHAFIKSLNNRPPRPVEGAEPPSKATSKNAKRRAKKRAGGDNGGTAAALDELDIAENGADAPHPADAVPSQSDTAGTAGGDAGASDPAKRLRCVALRRHGAHQVLRLCRMACRTSFASLALK